jgi:hypothetical protein
MHPIARGVRDMAMPQSMVCAEVVFDPQLHLERSRRTPAERLRALDGYLQGVGAPLPR